MYFGKNIEMYEKVQRCLDKCRAGKQISLKKNIKMCRKIGVSINKILGCERKNVLQQNYRDLLECIELHKKMQSLQRRIGKKIKRYRDVRESVELPRKMQSSQRCTGKRRKIEISREKYKDVEEKQSCIPKCRVAQKSTDLNKKC